MRKIIYEPIVQRAFGINRAKNLANRALLQGNKSLAYRAFEIAHALERKRVQDFKRKQ